MFKRDGMATYGWYTDLERQNEYIHYAYQVGNQTFGGQESWVNPVDWRLMEGAPYVFRVLFQLRKPTPAEKWS
jgi:hypothetical protein